MLFRWGIGRWAIQREGRRKMMKKRRQGVGLSLDLWGVACLQGPK